ncbi:BrnT family toxin [Tolypothrix sp. VBCCA 56010]|uniref:BrnT family toxin n=1 Tax=Tolypothrix sp. VBCCA 56010 TaxID=3137731 RepID=UPI003D7ECDE5
MRSPEREKHDVTFEKAAEVFFDPFYQVGDATANNEQRDFIIGYSLSQRLLLVVYVERVKRSRIISPQQSYMKNPEELELNLRPRATETVSIKIPTDTLQYLKKVAASRDMSVEALLKLYIGQNLRQDLAKL